jgi:hypothetical protein
MKKIFYLLFTLISLNSFSQKDNEVLVYKPIYNTNLEESFPMAAVLIGNLELSLEEFDYGKKRLKSSWYEYYSGISRYRAKFLFTIDGNNTLNLDLVETQWWYSSKGVWESSSGGFFKKADKIRAAVIETVRIGLSEEDIKKQNKDWFFKDLMITTLFFERATELAGERWFELYLKDKKIEWNVTFVDIEKNNASNGYKYLEKYIYTTNLTVFDINLEKSKFFIFKYTNSDATVLAQKGDMKMVNGYIRKLNYDDGIFNVIITENIEDKVPQKNESDKNFDNNTKSILEDAEKLKSLKELLDMEIITQEEFDAEKKKILNGE